MMLPSRSLGFMILVVALKTLGGNSEKEGVYKKVGDTVILTPGSAPASITRIKWTHDQDIALEWTRREPYTSWHFRDGCEVDTSTGVLTISNLALNDSGSYTAEINDEVMSTTTIIVITTVPNPTVSTWCNPEMTYCILTCEPNVTDDAKPITYYWVIGDMVKQSPTNQFNITQENRERLISCQLENPVSHEYSEKILNPLLIRNRALLSLPFVGILVFLFGLICCKCCCCTRRTRSHRRSTTTNTVR